MAVRNEAVLRLVLDLGYQRRDEPFRLSAGGWTHDYVDAKRAMARGADLELVARAVDEAAVQAGWRYEAVGGLTMGADSLAIAVAMVSRCRWFSVRKEPKGHGRGRQVEGAELEPGCPVLLVEDVVTTGASMLRALDAVEAAGARAVGATAVVDRGSAAGPALAARGVPFRPLLTFADLEIAPVGSGAPEG